MLLLLVPAVLLWAAVAVTPALAAASSEARLEVNENCVEPYWPCWATPGSSQPAATVTLPSGGSITFVDDETPANIAWTGTEPMCESEVPVAPASPTTGWEGKCTFLTPGAYTFESTSLWFEYTRYEVVVVGTPNARTTLGSAENPREAMLMGNIEPEGNAIQYHFDYGSTSVTEHSSAPTNLGATDFTSHSVSLPVSGLAPGTEYHFELVLGYGAGQIVSGGPQSFTTPPAAKPTVSTSAASALAETEATLNGRIDPESGAEAEYFFEWGAGTGATYEHTTQAVSLPADSAEHSVSATVTGLMPSGEYHFRLIAKNEAGMVQGQDLTFMAPSTPPTKEPTKESPEEPTQEPPAKEPSSTPASTTVNPTVTTDPPSSGQPKSEPASGPQFGSVELASAQHGEAVHGSLIVSSTGSGGRLQIELLAKGAAAPLGKLMRSSLHAGKLTFALPLSAEGKGTLRRHRRLALTVRITLTPAHGTAMTVTRTVVVRA
jgi:hypothetical protein